MKRKNFLILIIIICFISCVKNPVDLVTPPEKLVKVLVDVHFVEGAMLSVKPAEKDSMREFYYNQIFEIHNLEKENFEKDMDVLKSNPEMMEKVYDKVLEELGKLDERNKKKPNGSK